MPITQPRMIALLNAAIDYQQAFDAAVQFLQRELQRAERGQLTWEEAARNMELMVKHTGMLTHPIQSYSIIQVERAHWRSHARRNINAAERQREKRATEGGLKKRRQKSVANMQFVEIPEPRTTAPNSMRRDGHLQGSIYDEVYQDEVTNGKPTPGRGEQRYKPDPSLAEDDEWEAPTPTPTGPGTGPLHSTLDEETKQQIEREAERAVAQHPGTAEEDKD
jgi:hypothetical protein